MQLVANRFPFSGPSLDGYPLDPGLLLTRRFKLGQELPLGLVQVAVQVAFGRTARDLLRLGVKGAGTDCSSQ